MPHNIATAIEVAIFAVVARSMPSGTICTINSLLDAATPIATAMLANMEKSI
jgi:hypothetical protein